MSKKYFILTSILSIIIIFPNNNYSQVNLNYSPNPSSQDFNFGNWFAGTKNFVELTYGIGDFNHEDIRTDFNPLIIKEFKFGKRYQKPIANYKLIEFSDNYLFSSIIEDNPTSKPLNIVFDFWRFGLGYKKGYGYNFDNFSILPYYQLGFVWNNSNIKHPYQNIRIYEDDGTLIKEDEILKKYNRNLRFGTTNIGGIDIKLNSLLTIGGAYETGIIFPAHLFWKQLGSFMIETLSQTGLDYLTQGVIIKNIPDIAPIFYFIFKNGLSYYLFTLKQKDMNWPFSTAAPLNFETVKFNLRISF